jgi:16S rRNA (uracil1498-N3)-methyltransferase
VYAFDGVGKEYLYRICRAEKKALLLQSQGVIREEKESHARIVLGFPLSKEEKVDIILQKATELGVSVFIPFISSRSISVAPSSQKIDRWRRIIMEATRQSDRVWLPVLKDICSFSQLVEVPSTASAAKFVAAQSGCRLENVSVLPHDEVLLMVGPEGDFSDEEKDLLAARGFRFVNVAKNILRVETAAIFAVGLLNYLISEKK